MQKKNLIKIGIGIGIVLLIFMAIPILHIYKTKINEKPALGETPEGYTNDASQLNLTRVDTIISIATAKAEMEVQIRELIQQAKGGTSQSPSPEQSIV